MTCAQCRTVVATLLSAVLVLIGGVRPSNGAPSPHTALRLATGTYLHLYALPLGLAPGVIAGGAAFDASGTRAVFVGSFPGSAVFGDPRRLNPQQAFLLDVPRRRLTQLSFDGLVQSVRWTGPDSIVVRDDGVDDALRVAEAKAAIPDTFRFSADQTPDGDLTVVSPEASDRLNVYRRSDGRYVVRQIGARRLRVVGVSPGGRFALVGENLAWLDSRPADRGTIDRAGASDSIAPRFDDAFGRQLVYIHPLSSSVYQGAYRDGIAYFAFSHGLTRVVAATRDFTSYFYPPMPDDPAYSVGDGLGALDDGSLYLAWPENLQLTLRRGKRYVDMPMTFPPGYSNPNALISSLTSSSGTPALWPPLQPDGNALDAAMLQWRVYPVGRGSSAGWIASYLGRVYRSGPHPAFARAQPPAFPFAVLTRLDDGTLWGASPVQPASFGSMASIARPGEAGSRASIALPSTRASIARPIAILWSSHDGAHWKVRYALDGSPGAVGSSGSQMWAALTKPLGGTSMICIASLGGDANPISYSTGGSYGGEQLFFASLSSGFYLVWGATPGRMPADQGSLSAFLLDTDTLTAIDETGTNAYVRARITNVLGGNEDTVFGDPVMLQETANELTASSGAKQAVLATNIAGAQRFAGNVLVRSIDGETEWQAEFGAQPSPLGIVTATADGAGLIVARSVWSAPLRGHGSTERWQRDGGGSWRLVQTLRNWSI
ncbi:MAG TPA: S24/S26 family peptidase [Candidatus Eremiobacteraceae bacterium]|nr:S24/S26 family peptidase [Candidatus Eremiobacteraceae bacterium]